MDGRGALAVVIRGPIAATGRLHSVHTGARRAGSMSMPDEGRGRQNLAFIAVVVVLFVLLVAVAVIVYT